MAELKEVSVRSDAAGNAFLAGLICLLVTVCFYEFLIIPYRKSDVDIGFDIVDTAFEMLTKQYSDQPNILKLLNEAKAGDLMGERKEEIEGLKLMSIHGESKKEISYLLAPVVEEYQPYLHLKVNKKLGVVTRVDVGFACY
jgi:hypothetical protein